MKSELNQPSGAASAGAHGSATRGDMPPLSKENWNHSEMVLVYYAADPEMDRTSKWSIAYYHHRPPFNQKPHWIDFNTSRGAPDFWWPLPELPNGRDQRPAN